MSSESLTQRQISSWTMASWFTTVCSTVLCLCLFTPTLASDDAYAFRLFTDGGNVVEIDNRALDNSISGLASLVPSGQSSSSAVYGFGGSPSSSSLGHKIETRSGSKTYFCGGLLINALALVCKGNYNKRTSSQVLSSEVDYPLQSQEHFGYEPYSLSEHQSLETGLNSWPDFFEILKNAGSLYRSSSKLRGNSQGMSSKIGGDRLRLKRGIVEECCRKPCTTSTLSQYCKYPNIMNKGSGGM